MLSLLVLLLVNLPTLPSWSRVELLGWTRDGSALAFRGTVYSLERPDGLMPCEMVFLVVADPDGIPERLYRLERRQPMDEVTWDDERADEVWKTAESEQEAEQWLAANPLVAAAQSRKFSGRMEMRQAGLRLTARLTFEGKGCRKALLQVQLGSGARPVLRDDCPADSESLTQFESSVQSAWSPDGKRAAIAWNVIRSAKSPPASRPPRSTSYYTIATNRPPSNSPGRVSITMPPRSSGGRADLRFAVATNSYYFPGVLHLSLAFTASFGMTSAGSSLPSIPRHLSFAPQAGPKAETDREDDQI